MPLGFERINVRQRTPNKLINFIKPLEGADKEVSQDILERVAAIVYPIMKENHLAVMSLEEHEANTEFWGRNFNFGEVIQLVLKSPSTGVWLPIRHVELVMIHELAHVKEMNHGRGFHKLRLAMQSQLTGLQGKGYTGEGFWAPGRALHPSANLTGDRRMLENEIPKELCGGTFKRAGGRRRRRRRGGGNAEPKQELSYAEKKKRRIEKKFGPGEGNAIGTDEELRNDLEGKGKKVLTKPRVAQSARGRELRAMAALQRFDKVKNEEEEARKREEEIEQDSDATEDEGDPYETENDYEEEPGELIKVEDTKEELEALEKEMEQLQMLACGPIKTESSNPLPPRSSLDTSASSARSKPDSSSSSSKLKEMIKVVDTKLSTTSSLQTSEKPSSSSTHKPPASSSSQNPTPAPKPQPTLVEKSNGETASRTCTVCSTPNELRATICGVCANVLVDNIPVWKCRSEICREGDGIYRNSVDFGVCGVCGAKKP